MTYSLRVACLGQEQIERDGDIVDASAWQGILPRAIFLYLLFLGPTERETIGLQFWPDSTASQIRDNFHTQVRRARQAVGQNTIHFEGDLYFINPKLDIWCDAFEFEKLVKQARLMSPRQRLVENWWRQAVELNKGELLPSLDADWILSRRETFQQMYSEAVLGLTNCLQKRERWGEAIPVLKQGLERDPLREDMYRPLMVSYARQGQTQQVVRHFETLKRVLFEELALEPSSETIHLFQSLVH
ncbi:MAG: BTAD domain-containing putative transcriptional regulator [Anaerolineae bacterium]